MSSTLTMVEKSSYQWDGDSLSLFDRQINSRHSFGGKTLKALSYKSQNVFFFFNILLTRKSSDIKTITKIRHLFALKYLIYLLGSE